MTWYEEQEKRRIFNSPPFPPEEMRMGWEMENQRRRWEMENQRMILTRELSHNGFGKKDYPMTPSEAYGNSHQYNFADDKDFASKMKFYYSQVPRRSGRTYLMAKILVEQAIETGQRICIVGDHERIHRDRRELDHYLYQQVQHIIHDYQSRGCHFDVRQGGRQGSSEGVWIEIRLLGNPHIYHKLRIPTYEPSYVPEYVMGHDSCKEEEDDELLITCKIK